MVPTAGRRMISAPASMNSFTVFLSMRFSPASFKEPEACILPAIRMISSPKSSRISLIALTMASFFTWLPGLPVRLMKSMPISFALRAFSAVALRPSDIDHKASEPSLISVGSRLMPTGRPISFFNRRIVSFSSCSGRPATKGLLTSNMFRITRSADKDATASGLLTSPKRGGVVQTHSAAKVLPSLKAMASRSSLLLNSLIFEYGKLISLCFIWDLPFFFHYPKDLPSFQSHQSFVFSSSLSFSNGNHGSSKPSRSLFS